MTQIKGWFVVTTGEIPKRPDLELNGLASIIQHIRDAQRRGAAVDDVYIEEQARMQMDYLEQREQGGCLQWHEVIKPWGDAGNRVPK